MSRPLLLTRRELVAGLSGVALTLACGRKTSDEPVAIAYGRDECAFCRMPVDDPHLAAEWVVPGQPAQVFGEPGCLLSWLAAHNGDDGTAWVRAREGDTWLRASDATFAHGVLTTPMNFNLTAHQSPPVAADGVRLLHWTELLEKGAPDARPS